MRLMAFIAAALCLLSAAAQAGPVRVWATYGEDKVLQDDVNGEDGPPRRPKPCVSRADLWCDDGVHLFGMGNEVVAFQLVVAAPDEDRRITAVSFQLLAADDGRTVLNGKPAACPADGDCSGLWGWQDRQIELFLVHYLPVHGISPDNSPELKLGGTCQRL